MRLIVLECSALWEEKKNWHPKFWFLLVIFGNYHMGEKQEVDFGEYDLTPFFLFSRETAENCISY